MAAADSSLAPIDASTPPHPPPPPPAPQAEEVKNTPEAKEDSSKSEKWAFIEPQPIREDQVRNAVSFLSHPKVRGSPIVHRRSFLERKGLTREEIDEAFRRVPDPPTNEGPRGAVPPEGKASLTAQPKSEVSQQIVAPQQPSKVQLSAASPPLAVVQSRSYPHWSQLIIGAGFIAAVGAGTGYLFQRIVVPKIKSWVQEVVQEDGGELRTKEGRGEVQGKVYKLSPLEEAVAAAAAAANAASVVATEMANTSRELLKSRNEEWKHLKSMLKSIETRTEELKNAYTDLRSLQSNTNGQTDGLPTTNSAGGYMKRLEQRTSPIEQVQIRPLQNSYKGAGFSDGLQASNGHSGIPRNHSMDLDDDYWWGKRKVEAESFISSARGRSAAADSGEAGYLSGEGKEAVGNGYVSQSAEEVSGLARRIEVGSDDGSGGETSSLVNGMISNRSRQGWVPPPVPQTVLPGALSAIRYKKPVIAEEISEPEIVSEEEMASTLPGAEPSIGRQEIASSSTVQELVEDGINESAHTNADHGIVEAAQ